MMRMQAQCEIQLELPKVLRRPNQDTPAPTATNLLEQDFIAASGADPFQHQAAVSAADVADQDDCLSCARESSDGSGIAIDRLGCRMMAIIMCRNAVNDAAGCAMQFPPRRCPAAHFQRDRGASFSTRAGWTCALHRRELAAALGDAACSG